MQDPLQRPEQVLPHLCHRGLGTSCVPDTFLPGIQLQVGTTDIPRLVAE
ncbi:hypothetical protein APTSU1_000313700 [Apodemus speciosus]|uniref:Uncharacterized protein n=1 Tax=Apodemus speciosus TaxID=105296 RepID=A0ABQ0ELG4_APOSI